MQRLARDGPKNNADPVSVAFKQKVMCRSLDCMAEPTFTDLRKVPAVQAFLSGFNQPLILRELQIETDGCISEKAIVILDQNRRELGITRWIRGQGDPFFYHLLGKPESVESVLANVPEPTVAEGSAVAPRAQDQPEYNIFVSKTLGYGEFRIPDDRVSLRNVANELYGGPYSGFPSSAFAARFDALKALSEARDFISQFKETNLRYELAGRVENGVLAEAAVYIMTADSNQAIAAIRWVRDQGNAFFQNFLNEASHKVDAIMAPIVEKLNAACVKSAPASG